MYNKKAIIVPVLGTVLVVFAIVVASVIGLVIGPTFQGEAMQKGGLGISIHNHAEFWIKALDESIQIISRRSAYDLGKSGGIIGPEVFTWFIGYPSMNTLQKNLESQIKDNLPQGTIKADRTIEWSSGFIDVLDYDVGTSAACGNLVIDYPEEECDDGNNIDGDGCSSTCLIEDLAFLSTCGIIRSSKCFFVKGNKSFSISDEDIEAKISLYPHKFDSKINSSYFRLLYVGRQILDNARYSSLLNDITGLINLLQADFPGLDFQIDIVGDVDPSLVGYWKFNEGLGSIANDFSVYGNDGTLVNNPQWVDGKFGKALKFESKLKNFVEIPDSQSIRVENNQMTIMMWIKKTNVAQSPGILANKGNPYGDVTYTFSVPSITSRGTEIDSRFEFYNPHHFVSLGVIGDTNWHHVAATYDGNILKVYKDRNLISSKTTGGAVMPTNTDPINIGAHHRPGAPNPIFSIFNGTIDEVKIYNRSLSEDEIKEEYSSIPKNIIEITITDKSCLPSEFYCLAPLKPGEDGIILGGREIPYDFLELKFRVDVNNLIAPPTCTRNSPTVTITPSTQTGSKGSSLIYTVNVKNNDGVDCESSTFDLNTVCPSGLFCVLDRDSLAISPGSTDSTIITVSSTLSTPSGTYTFKVRATNSREIDYWKEGSADYVIPRECTIQTECAQACDSLGIDFKWHGRNCVSGICSIYEIWTGTCPGGDENCMTGQCCIGECQSNECVCFHTNYVDVYGSRCPSGQTCGEDCYCHPTSTCTADIITTVIGSGPCTVALFMSTSGCDRQIWEIRNSTGQVCAGIVSNPVSCPNQNVQLGSHIYSLYINGIRKDSEEVVCVTPTCVGELMTSVFDPGTGSCTIGASFIPYNCETKLWEIRDADNNIRCSGTLPNTNCPAQWSFSGTTYTYLYIDGELKSTKTDTCKAGPTCSAVLSPIRVSGEGSCTFLADFSHANCDSKSWEIKDRDSGTVVCSETLPDNSCQWNTISGASGTTYNYELWIDGSLQDIDSARCNPECLLNSDCDDGSRCTDNICNNGICNYPPKPAGTVFDTKSGYCPPYCSAGTKYTPTVLKTCERKCDGVTANEPDCDYTSGCTPSDYSSALCQVTQSCLDKCSGGYEFRNGQSTCYPGCAADGINCGTCTPPCADSDYTRTSCGTSSITCPNKCEGGIEYSGGHTKTCNIGCADSVNCASSCTPSSCGSSDYDTARTCYLGCKDDETPSVRCWGAYLCSEKYCSTYNVWCGLNGCGYGLGGGSCTVEAQVRREGASDPSCTYQWPACAGTLCSICQCTLETCTASCTEDTTCTYGKFCQKQTTSYSDYCQCCALGCNTYWSTNSCTVNAQCAYPGSEPTCTYYTDYVCDCFGAAGYNFRWESSATFTATCS